MKTKQLTILIIVLVVVIGLLTVGRFTGVTVTGLWQDTEVECLVQGHQSVGSHEHAELRVFEDGNAVVVPANIGVSGTCLAELHTHQGEVGIVHIETTSLGKTYTLADFFGVWGQSFVRDGETPVIEVNGEVVGSPEEVVFADGQSIILSYGEDNSKSNTEDEASMMEDSGDHQ
jgi:hypothetical protein